LALLDVIKHNLAKLWQPSSSYQFPKNVQLHARKQRVYSFQFVWFSKFT